MGYSQNFATNVIKRARYVMIRQGYEIYRNKKITEVPLKAVESILGDGIFSNKEDYNGKNQIW